MGSGTGGRTTVGQSTTVRGDSQSAFSILPSGRKNRPTHRNGTLNESLPKQETSLSSIQVPLHASIPVEQVHQKTPRLSTVTLRYDLKYLGGGVCVYVCVCVGTSFYTTRELGVGLSGPVFHGIRYLPLVGTR